MDTLFTATSRWKEIPIELKSMKLYLSRLEYKFSRNRRAREPGWPWNSPGSLYIAEANDSMSIFDTYADLKDNWLTSTTKHLTDPLQVGILDSLFTQTAPAVLSPITRHYFYAQDILIKSLGGETDCPRDSPRQFLL